MVSLGHGMLLHGLEAPHGGGVLDRTDLVHGVELLVVQGALVPEQPLLHLEALELVLDVLLLSSDVALDRCVHHLDGGVGVGLAGGEAASERRERCSHAATAADALVPVVWVHLQGAGVVDVLL